jgi:hypothetical protein
MAELHGWAFAVARGRRKGYQTLLAPDFLAASNEYGVLGQATGGDTTTGVPTTARLHGLAAGDVVLTYQTQRLTSADLPGDEPLTDEFGRPLDLLYGFAIRGAGLSTVDDADFLAAKGQALRTYQHFLSDESAFELEESAPFVLRSTLAELSHEPAAEPVPFAEPAPFPTTIPEPARARGIRRTAILGAVLVIALFAALWFVVLRDDGPVTDVELTGHPQPVDCNSPITLEATIKTSAEATVVYHWETTVADDTAPETISLAEASEQSVQTRLQLNDKTKFTATLVVDEPNSKEASRDYTLTCR